MKCWLRGSGVRTLRLHTWKPFGDAEGWEVGTSWQGCYMWAVPRECPWVTSRGQFPASIPGSLVLGAAP